MDACAAYGFGSLRVQTRQGVLVSQCGRCGEGGGGRAYLEPGAWSNPEYITQSQRQSHVHGRPRPTPGRRTTASSQALSRQAGRHPDDGVGLAFPEGEGGGRGGGTSSKVTLHTQSRRHSYISTAGLGQCQADGRRQARRRWDGRQVGSRTAGWVDAYTTHVSTGPASVSVEVGRE